MTQDQSELEASQPPRHRGGRLVAAGVVLACVSGAGLGLWARPAAHERREGPPAPRAQVAALAAAAPRRLEIVIEDKPAPIGAPLEVMPAHAELAAPPLVVAEQPRLPRAAPPVLVKVETPTPQAVPAPVRVAARPDPAPAKAEVKATKAKAKAARPEVRLAKADAAKTSEKRKTAKVEVAKAEKAKARKAETLALAKAEKTKARKAKAKKPEPEVVLAKAENAPEKAGAAKKSGRLASIAKAVKAAPKTLKPRSTELAEAKPVRDRPEKATVLAAARPKARDMTKAAAKSCVSSDPGEALVCANPRLAQRDRQLQRAYRDAESAGVPASALRRQQERWIAARAAAAKEAPWAVEDVYEARIAELNDLARDGRDF